MLGKRDVRYLLRVVIGMLTLAVFASGAKERDWKTGKVTDAESYRRTYATGSTSQSTTTGTVGPDNGAGSSVNATTTTNTRVEHTQVKTNLVLIVGEQYVYYVEDSSTRGGPIQGSYGAGYQLGRIIRNRKHGCRFVVGEDVKYAQEKSTLHVIDADAKECSLVVPVRINNKITLDFVLDSGAAEVSHSSGRCFDSRANGYANNTRFQLLAEALAALVPSDS